MSKIHPECPDSEPTNRCVAADVLLREGPDQEEEEDEEDDDNEQGDDDGEDDGYSE